MDFSFRFFPPLLARRPVNQRVSRPKADGTVRICVLGESAAQGDPAPEFGFCRQLEAMLEHDYPGQQFDVINAGVTAINSHVIRDIARDTVPLRPDICIAYIGNNEVVGPYGPGNVLTPALQTLPVIRLHEWLKRLRLTQAAETAMRRIGLLAGGPKQWAGMEMFAGKRLAIDDPQLERVTSHFRKNMSDIVGVLAHSGAHVLLCTVAVNLADCPPFASEHSTDISPADREQFDALLRDSAPREIAGESTPALVLLQKAVQVSPNHAEAHYRLGKALAATGTLDEAAVHFSKARDLDTLRFRIDSTLNAVIRSLGTQYGDAISLVDLDKNLSEVSGGAPGRSLFYEHVHMTFHGNFVIASELMKVIRPRLARRGGAFAQPIQPPMTEPEVAKRLCWYPCDEREQWMGIAVRMRRPPFTGQWQHDAILADATRRGTGTDTDEQLTTMCQEIEKVMASHPRDNMVRHLLSKTQGRLKRYDDALANLRLILRDVPNDAMALHNLGFCYLMLGKNEEAAAAYEAEIPVADDVARARYALGQTYVRLGRFDDAMAVYRTQEAISGKRPRALADLAREFVAKNERERALPLVAEALRLEPSNREANALNAMLMPSHAQQGSTATMGITP